MAMSNTLKNALLNAIFNSTSYVVAADSYVSLHVGDPGTTGANEVTGGSYARIQVPTGAAASGAVTSTSNLTWTGMPAVTITHIGVWDALAGNFLVGGALTVAQAVSGGGTFQINTGDFDALF